MRDVEFLLEFHRIRDMYTDSMEALEVLADAARVAMPPPGWCNGSTADPRAAGGGFDSHQDSLIVEHPPSNVPIR